MVDRRKFLTRTGSVLAMASAGIVGNMPLTAAAATDDGYPDRPVKMIVPYPPGGPVDVVGRMIAQKLTEYLKQSVIIENVGGANGNIGCQAAARSKADGYTLLFGSAGPLTINPSLYAKMPFKVTSDFAPISLVVQMPLVVVVRPTSKVRNIAELIALAKSKPGELTFGSAGNGSTQHLAGELFKASAGIDMRHIPYRGAAPALTDLLAGHIDFMIELTPTVMAHLASGKLQALAVTTLERIPLLPEVPTMNESGSSNFEVISWFGVLAPAGTPAPVLSRLNAAVVQATRDPGVRESLTGRGVLPLESTQAAFDARIRGDLAKWEKVVKDAGIRME